MTGATQNAEAMMTGVEEETLAFAFSYARLGLEVFPLHYPVEHGGRRQCSCGNADCESPAKHPYARLAPKGCLNASRDPRIVQRWFRGAPYNLGIRTGAASGIVVIDVDPRHGGDETLAELERRFGALPPTWRFLTGGGGEHILFRHPGYRVQNQNGDGRLGDGLDVRGDGGYIVAPGSRHISGRYYEISVDHHPDEIALAEVPIWLAVMLRPTEKRCAAPAAMPETWRKLIAEGVAEGRRNDAVARLAGHLLRPGPKDPFLVLDVLRVWNATRCRPPLDDVELVRTVNSIAAREIARRGENHRG
jgi:hypothetical protein